MEALEGEPNGRTRHVKRGGYVATFFVFAMVTLENIGFTANLVGFVGYFMEVMHFDLSKSATTVTNYTGSAFLLTILGGFISDTYLTRVNTILASGFLEITGWIFLVVQAHYPSLHVNKDCATDCLHGRNARIFYLSLALLTLGCGGVRGCITALGGDQFDSKNPKEREQQASYFNWYMLFFVFGAIIGVTIIIWVAENKSWALAFLISMILAIIGFMFLALGIPFYRVRTPGDGPLLKVIQVIVVSIRNFKLKVPHQSELYNKKDDGTEEILCHTNQFRFLDKAAILPQGTSPQPWRVCTITQVEEVKILLRMLPILFSTVIMNTCLAQLQTFSVEQGYIMDRKLGPNFTIPASSIPVFPLVAMVFLIILYELVFVPFARRITGHPSGITHLQRVGVGLILSIISMVTAAIIEKKRRDEMVNHMKQISLFWLAIQYGIFGIADMFTFVGLLQFFYNEAPEGLRSLSTSLTFLSMSFGYFLSSALVHIVNSVSRGRTPNKLGWLDGVNLNLVYLDRFYWLLAILTGINTLNYLLCAYWYKYKNHGIIKEEDEIIASINGEEANKE